MRISYLQLAASAILVATITASCDRDRRSPHNDESQVPPKRLAEHAPQTRTPRRPEKSQLEPLAGNTSSQIEKDFLALTAHRTDPDKFRLAFTKLWNAQDCLSFREAPSGNSDFAVTVADKSLGAYERLLSDVDGIGDLMRSGRFSFTESDEEFKVVSARLYLAVNVLRSGFVPLPELIFNEAEKHQGTRMEIANFFVFATALRELPTGGAGATTLDEWEKVAENGSPIWQLIAIKGAGQATDSTSPGDPESASKLREDKLHFLRTFAQSDSALLQQEALNQLGNLGIAEAESFIKEALHSGSIQDSESQRVAGDSIKKSKFIRKLREAGR